MARRIAELVVVVAVSMSMPAVAQTVSLGIRDVILRAR